MFLTRLITILSFFFIFSCNSNKSEEEMEELWSKAQTRQAIIDRSGTPFNSGVDPEVALRDAENRLASGGGLFGNGGLSLDFFDDKKNKNETNKSLTANMPINVFLWRGALETIDFMPLSSADPIGGIIITDWYSTTDNEEERCKLNIFITGQILKTENLKVTSFCQSFKNQIWVNKTTDKNNNIKIENAILNKAKKLKLQSS